MKNTQIKTNVERVFKIEYELRKAGYIPTHSAMRKGYVRKNQSHIESYDGRFGKGYILHYENCIMNKSNKYHVIQYYIKNNK